MDDVGSFLFRENPAGQAALPDGMAPCIMQGDRWPQSELKKLIIITWVQHYI